MKNYFKLKIRSVALICICFVISLSILQNTKMVQSAENTCTMIMDVAKNITATFATNLTNFLLTVTKAGTGSGTVTSAPTGINCGSDCTENYTSGTSVTLTAAPASGSTFAGWTGDCAVYTPPIGEIRYFDTQTTEEISAGETKTFSFTQSESNKYSLKLKLYGYTPTVQANYKWFLPDGTEFPKYFVDRGIFVPDFFVGSSSSGGFEIRAGNNPNPNVDPVAYPSIPTGTHTLTITGVDAGSFGIWAAIRP